MPAEPILSVRGSAKRFEGLLALAGVDFDVARGEIFGVIGPNGAGKTTLFSCLVGATAPRSGADLLPRRAHRRPPESRDRRARPRADASDRAPVPRNDRRGKRLDRRALRLRRAPQDGRRASGSARSCRATSLAGRAGALAGTLTIGELKRLEIARALATEPEVLCLDEVMGGLNPSEIVGAMSLIRAIRDSGVTVLMIEHHVHAVRGVSDRILVLNFGRKIAEGKPEEVMRDPEVVKAYLGDETTIGA